MVAATGNKGKLREIQTILDTEQVLSLKDINATIEVEEDGQTFYENALKKAKETYRIINEPVLADDSGLCVSSLNGFPGVETRRFLGEEATDADRNEYLIQAVQNKEDRSARMICVVVYYDGENTLVGEGVLQGRITEQRRGTNGFGFDEILELPNGKTLAELTDEEKNEISARKIALENLKAKLNKLNGEKSPVKVKK